MRLHFDAFDLDAPRIRGLVQTRLHGVRDGLPFGKDLGQAPSSQDRSQRTGSQQSSRVAETRRRLFVFE